MYRNENYQHDAYEQVLCNEAKMCKNKQNLKTSLRTPLQFDRTFEIIVTPA